MNLTSHYDNAVVFEEMTDIMANELETSCGMKYIGLLTHQQKQAGYFVSQDEDFVWLWKANDGRADIVAVFLYESVTIKQVRDKAEEDIK